MRHADHFHAVWKTEDSEGEIEGGWTDYPSGWNDMTRQQKDQWIEELCIAWGMPRGAEVTRIWLAG